jgi:hypothetical protein
MKKVAILFIVAIGFASFNSCQKDVVYTVSEITGIYEGTGDFSNQSAEITKVGESEVNIRIFSDDSSFETVYLNNLVVDITYAETSKTGRASLLSWEFRLSEFSTSTSGTVTTTSATSEFLLLLNWLNGSFQGSKQK